MLKQNNKTRKNAKKARIQFLKYGDQTESCEKRLSLLKDEPDWDS